MPKQDRSSSAGTTASRRVCLFVLLLFVLAATAAAIRKDVTRGFDELAHASYVAHIQKTGDAWPAFDDMRDPAGFRFIDEKNYLNHLPIYYGLLAVLGPGLEGRPDAIVVHRLLNIVLAAIGLAALMSVGLMAPLSRLRLYVFVVPLACMPSLVPVAGAINNDNLAFAGGAMATLGAWRMVSVGGYASLLIALLGFVIASWAKLTAMLLVGGLIGGVLLWTLWRGRLQMRWSVPIVIAGLLAAAPYAVLYVQYGSPAPATAGQLAMVAASAQRTGIDIEPRVTPVFFIVRFISTFVTNWMPALDTRTAVNYIALSIPIATIALAFAGIAISLRRIIRRQESALDVVVVAAALAFTVTFVIHIVFDYRYYVPYGWVSAAPRYYMPLAALVPLACLSLLDATGSPRMYAALAGFLIGGPIVFRIFGMPL